MASVSSPNPKFRNMMCPPVSIKSVGLSWLMDDELAITSLGNLGFGVVSVSRLRLVLLNAVKRVILTGYGQTSATFPVGPYAPRMGGVVRTKTAAEVLLWEGAQNRIPVCRVARSARTAPRCFPPFFEIIDTSSSVVCGDFRKRCPTLPTAPARQSRSCHLAGDGRGQIRLLLAAPP